MKRPRPFRTLLKLSALPALAALLACSPLLGFDKDYYVGGGSGGVAGSVHGGGQGATPDAEAGAGGDGGSPAVAGATGESGGAGAVDDEGFPIFLPAGKLVYQRSSSIGSSDSELFVVEFPGNSAASSKSPELSAAFGICNARSGIFSADGNQLAVEAYPQINGSCAATPDPKALEIYVLDLRTVADAKPNVVRVTNNAVPDQDPRFGPPGSDFLLFSDNGRLAEWSLASATFSNCDVASASSFCFTADSGTQQSKPVISDANRICYLEGTGAGGDLYCFDRTGVAGQAFKRIGAITQATVSDTQPMIYGDWLYYSRWKSSAAPYDRIARTSVSVLPQDPSVDADFESFMPFGSVNYTDPSAIDDNLILLTTDTLDVGLHDIAIGLFQEAKLRSIDRWLDGGLNSAKDEREPSYWVKR